MYAVSQGKFLDYDITTTIVDTVSVNFKHVCLSKYIILLFNKPLNITKSFALDNLMVIKYLHLKSPISEELELTEKTLTVKEEILRLLKFIVTQAQRHLIWMEGKQPMLPIR